MNAFLLSPLFSALVLLAGSAAVGATITAFSQRKNVDANAVKTKAEAAQIVSQTALAQNQAMATQIAELRAALQAHREWDKRVVKIVRDAGLQIDDPPELWL